MLTGVRPITGCANSSTKCLPDATTKRLRGKRVDNRVIRVLRKISAKTPQTADEVLRNLKTTSRQNWKTQDSIGLSIRP